MPSTVRFTKRKDPQAHIETLQKRYETVWRDATDFFVRRAAEYVAKDTSNLMFGIPEAIRPEDLVKAMRDSFDEEAGRKLLTTRLHMRVPYAAYIEYGTSPHPVSREGVKRLRKWAKRHGFPAKVGDAIAWKIRHHGSKPMPFIRPALRDTISYLRDRMRDVRGTEKPTGGADSLLDTIARISVFGERLLGRGARIIRRLIRAGR